MNHMRGAGIDLSTDTTRPRRWECHCQRPPFLLATYEANGRINIKVRDRYWHIEGIVRTTCPRCGTEHLLDVRSAAPADDSAGPAIHSN